MLGGFDHLHSSSIEPDFSNPFDSDPFARKKYRKPRTLDVGLEEFRSQRKKRQRKNKRICEMTNYGEIQFQKVKGKDWNSKKQEIKE